MAISEKKSAKYESAFDAVIKNDLKEVMKLVSSMQALRYNEKCPVEDSPFFRCNLLHAAAIHSNPEVITFLINKGISLGLKNDAGQTPLHYVISMRKKNVCDILKIMLEAKGSSVNAKDSDGDSLLHYAVSHDIKTVKLLIENKARVNIFNCWGESPLHTASERGDIEIMQYLLTHKADIEMKDSFGCTPLRSALNGCEPEKAIKFLLKAGSNTSDRDLDGNTTLHAAVMAGENDVIKLLISAEADRAVVNNDGKTAFDICTDKKLKEKLRPPKRKRKVKPIESLSIPKPILTEIIKPIVEKRQRKKRVVPTQDINI